MSENIQKNYYAIIPANVRYNKRLTLLSRLLYGEITALCNEKGYCWATNSYFAELYEVSEKTISNSIAQLKEYGYIKIEYKKVHGYISKREIYINNCNFVNNTLHEVPSPMEENVNSQWKKTSTADRKKIPSPMEENVKHNNTNNNTNNNTEREKEPLANDEVEILLNHTQFSSFEDFEKVYIFWFTKLTGKPITLLNQTVSTRGENFEKLDWLKKNFEARRVHAGIAIFETLEYIAQDKTCIDNYRFRASSYLDGIISRLVDAKLAESDPVSNECKGRYRNPSFDYFKY